MLTSSEVSAVGSQRALNHCKAGAVSFTAWEDGHGAWFVVMDPEHFRVRFFAAPERRTFAVGIDAEWSDEYPGELASYTPSAKMSKAPGMRL